MLTAGEGGLVVELGDRVDPAVNARVRWLARAVAERLAGPLEVVPTYRSLLVVHDPLRVARARLVEEVEALLAELPRDAAAADGGRTVTLPACYGGAFGPDLEDVARHTGLSPEEVIALHAGASYLVYMLGFTPGFPYLGGLSPRLATPRLAVPRTRVPAGGIGIGGEQTGIYPVESPGGWRLIARTPVRLFDPVAPSPFLLAAGDTVRFAPVSEEEYQRLAQGQPPLPGPLPAPRGEGDRGALVVLKPGLLTTVQDEGRPGYRASGMPLAGALDRRAFALANLLAGNAPGAAALELTLLGGTFRFERDAYLGLAGADLGATLDGAQVPTWSGFPVRAGAVLALGAARAGARAYLAVRGGLDVPLVLGSRSTYARAAVGGLRGRQLAAGDVLPVGRCATAAPGPRRLPPRLVPGGGREVRLRVLLGPQDDRFLPEGVAAFLGGAYTVTNRNDRMGYQLEGPAIRHAEGPDIVSDALLPGAVQVPGSGQPIVMMADGQTVGGYAKIATVIGPDLPALAQARLGDTVRFERCTQAQAVAALRRERALLDEAAALLAAGGGA